MLQAQPVCLRISIFSSIPQHARPVMYRSGMCVAYCRLHFHTTTHSKFQTHRNPARSERSPYISDLLSYSEYYYKYHQLKSKVEWYNFANLNRILTSHALFSLAISFVLKQLCKKHVLFQWSYLFGCLFISHSLACLSSIKQLTYTQVLVVHIAHLLMTTPCVSSKSGS